MSAELGSGLISRLALPAIVSPRLLRRGWTRRIWLVTVFVALWSNRADVRRWGRFLIRAVRERGRRPLSDVVTELRVRAAVSSDPLLRRDRALDDLRVDDGVVTLLTTTAGWPDPRDQMVKIKQVRGITDVTSRLAPAPVGSSVVT
jgi:hypothetical protein